MASEQGDAARSDLSKRLHDLADAGHERALECRAKADAFDRAAKGFYADPQTVDAKSFLGAWARARRLYSDCTPEPQHGE